MTSYKKTMRQALEEMYPIVEEVELDEAKYELYHKDFSSAMQHAYHVAKKHHGITIDPKEIDDKVATGPSKPSEGKTNKYRLKGDKGAVQIQVYNKGGSKPFELNMYKEEVELDESVIDKVKQIASKKSAAKIDGVMVDSFTASAISQIYDKVNDANKKKMDSLPITKLANLAFKMMNKEEVGLDEAQDGGDFKPHMMYDPKTGKGYKADTMDDHLRMKKMGYTHDAPKKEEVEIDEAIPKSEYYYVDPKGVVVAVGSKDAMRKMNMKQAKDGNKGGSFSQNSKKYKVGDKIKEEVDLDEGKMKDLLIKAQELMGPSKNRKEGIQMVAKGLKVSEKEATKLVDAVIKMNEELAKIKGKTPGDEGRRSAVEDDIERAEKKGDKKEVEKLKEADLDEGKMKKGDTVTVLIGPHKGDKHEIIHDFGDGTYNVRPIRVPKIKYKLGAVKAKASDLKKEEVDLEEGKMSQLHQYIKDKKSAEEIAKLMKVDVKTIKALMSSYESTDGDNMEQNSEYMEMLAAACGGGSGGGSMEMDYNPMEEGAAADARRAMKKDKDFSRRDRADDDDSATDDDIKAASKNIMMQMRKVISMRGDFKVEFGDKKKVKIPVKVAQVVQQKYNSMKRPADKEKFQAQVAKSYKDMLKVLKAGYHEELKPQKESILDRIDKKLKERKNG